MERAKGGDIRESGVDRGQERWKWKRWKVREMEGTYREERVGLEK